MLVALRKPGTSFGVSKVSSLVELCVSILVGWGKGATAQETSKSCPPLGQQVTVKMIYICAQNICDTSDLC